MGMYLIGWATRKDSPSRPLSRKTRTMPSGSGVVPSFDSLSLVKQVHAHELVAVLGGAVAVLDLERHRLALEAPHPLRPAVGDRLGAFDGVDEVLAQALLDDFLGLAAARRRRGAPRPARLVPTALPSAASFLDSSALRPRNCRAPLPCGICANWAIFSTRLILPTTSRTWAFSYSSPELFDTRTKPSKPICVSSGSAMQHVVGRPGDAAGEVGDLDRRLAVDLALDVPVEHLRLGVREGRVEHVQLVGLGQEPQLHRGRVDQRVGPTELQAG